MRSAHKATIDPHIDDVVAIRSFDLVRKADNFLLNHHIFSTMKSLPGAGLTSTSVFSLLSKIAVVTALFLMISVLYWWSFEAERWPGKIAFLEPAKVDDEVESTLAPGVRELVVALRREVVKVERNTGLSADAGFDLGRWREENACASRSELERFYRASPNRKDVAGGGEQWVTVMAEYARLHRLCIRAAGNLTEYFYGRSRATGCRFFISEVTTGLGNKLFVMAPSVLYAVLTQRVILIPESTGVPDLMCEPFPGSSWRLSADLWRGDVPIWNQTDEFLRNVDTAKREHGSTLPIYASRIDDRWLPVSRFFCDVEQAYFRQVPWLTVEACLYFLPKLFAIPSHRVTLEALFPDPSVVLTHILRSAFLPRDDIWSKVKDREHLSNSSRSQVGIQARYFNNSEAKHRVINANVESCLVENALLEQTPGRMLTIFIASLTPDLRARLQEFISRNPASREIAFEQLSSKQEQRSGVAVYRQVLVEILRLSFSHTLLVSPASTLGGVAQAYGALTPWFIETHDDVTTPCMRAQTTDGCFQSADSSYHCPYDSEISKDGKSVYDFVHYLKPCLQIDTSGMQLIDELKNSSSH